MHSLREKAHEVLRVNKIHRGAWVGFRPANRGFVGLLFPLAFKSLNLTICIDLSAPPKERWNHAVDIIWEEVHAVFELFDAALDEFLESQRWYFGRLGDFAFSGIGSFLRIYNKRLGPEYSEELAGFAKAFGLPYWRLLSANLVYDILLAAEERPPSACPSFSCPGKNGNMLLGRNLDWAWPEALPQSLYDPLKSRFELAPLIAQSKCTTKRL